VVGGVAWERFVVDPVPGPRSAGEIRDGSPLGKHAVLARAETSTPEGVRFSEAHVAAHLRSPTVLIDITGGAPGAAEGIAAAAGLLGCDLVICVDVGGDALATGSEPGLASPLCDAVMLAAAARHTTRLDVVAAVIGAGCDGELTVAEVLGRIAALAAAGAWIGSSSVTSAQADEIEQVALAAGSEASKLVAHCARGETGEVAIRAGRRQVALGPIGALGFYFDLEAATAELPLAAAVADAERLETAREALAAIGIRTELDYERERAGR